jgi:hypothetical protein
MHFYTEELECSIQLTLKNPLINIYVMSGFEVDRN